MLVVVQASFAPALALMEHVLERLEILVQRQTKSRRGSEAGEVIPVLPVAEVVVVRRRLRLLRALLASRTMLLRDDAEGMHQLVEELVGLVSQEEVSWKIIGLLPTFWLNVTLQREGALLIEQLREVKREARFAGDHRVMVHVVAWLADAYLVAGRWHLVEQESLEGLAQAERIGFHTALAGYLQGFLANTYYAWNRLEEAAACVQQKLSCGQTWQHATMLMEGHLALTQIELARGELDAANQALQQAEALIQQERMVYAAFWLAALRVQYWLATGDLAQASMWATHTEFQPQTWRPNQTRAILMQVRVYLAQQQNTQALEALERWSPYLDRPVDGETTTQFLALLVVSLYGAEQREQATRVAARLLALTEPEGHIRVYLDLGTPMRQVLKMLLEAAPDDEPSAVEVAISRPYVSHLLATFEQEGRKSTPGQVASPVPAQKALPHPPQTITERGLIEPLSRQEHQVLRLLVAGSAYAEMAQTLVVSPNTIKTQVSSIYRKLGVSRRAEAIALAQRWQLLSPEPTPGDRLP